MMTNLDKAFAKLKPISAKALICGFLSLVVLTVNWAHAEDSPALSKLEIITKNGTQHQFNVELAITDEQKLNGLMYRKTLPKNQGMLFIYPHAFEIEMWMKNTYIPLDMLFIDEAGRIVSIAHHTKPLSLETIRSKAAAIAVLELNAGTAKELSIQTGDKVLHSNLAKNN